MSVPDIKNLGLYNLCFWMLLPTKGYEIILVICIHGIMNTLTSDMYLSEQHKADIMTTT